MLWDRLFKKKSHAAPTVTGKPRLNEFPEPGDGTDEWAFLRDQPDHDADEMANVHRNADESSPSASAVTVMNGGAPPPPPMGLDGPAPIRPRHGLAPKPVLELQPCGNSGPRRVLALRVVGANCELVRRLDGELLIGRNLEPGTGRAEIDLADDTGVDRRHALIRREDGNYLLRDLHSAGGTRLNGRPLDPDTEAWLKPGDEIEMGVCSRLVVTEAPADPYLTEEDLLLADILQSALGNEDFGASVIRSGDTPESSERTDPDAEESHPSANLPNTDDFSAHRLERVAHVAPTYSRTAYWQPGDSTSPRGSWL
jgi:hypothetical protein